MQIEFKFITNLQISVNLW